MKQLIVVLGMVVGVGPAFASQAVLGTEAAPPEFAVEVIAAPDPGPEHLPPDESEGQPLPIVIGTAALFPFDENAGDKAMDLTSNHYVGRIKDSVTWVEGFYGAALHFGDSGAFMKVDGIEIGDSWTIQVWTLFPLEAPSDGWRTLVQGAPDQNHVMVDPEGQLGVLVGDTFTPCDSGVTIQGMEGWHLISAVGSEGATTFYINGEMVGKADSQSTVPIRFIGNREDGGQNWGTIDCLRILNGVRSHEEIAQDAAWVGVVVWVPNPTPDPILPTLPGTKAVYSFAEGTGIHTADASGNGFHGDLYGAAWETGLIGSGLRFGGMGADLSVPSIAIGSAWTLQGWTRFPLETSGEGWRTFAAGGGMHVTVGSDGMLGVYTNQFHPCGYNIGTLSGWHLLSAVGSGGQTTFYVDGEAVGTSAAQVTSPVLYIGNAGSFSVAQTWGLIDSFRIFTGARSAAEVVIDANPVPNLPANIGQFSATGAPVSAGGSTHGAFVVKAGVSHIISFPALIQVEVKPVGTAFDGTTGLYSGTAAASGTTASVEIDAPPVGSFHWRVRSQNNAGGPPSGWVNYGSALATVADISFFNSTPTASSWSQRRASDGATIAEGDSVFDAEGVRFEVTPVDGDQDQVQVQVEVCRSDVSFSGQPTHQGAFGASGGNVLLRADLPKGEYGWQFRVVDSMGVASAWTRPGSGDAADFEVVWAGSKSVSGCVGASSGGPVLGAWMALLGAAACLGLRKA